MKNLKSTVFNLSLAVLFLMNSSCEQEQIIKHQSVTTNTGINHRQPNGFTDLPLGGRYPYPDIIKRDYSTPEDEPFHSKCFAYRITWPDYDGGFDVTKIPTMFSANGALNSFYFLNNVGVKTSLNTLFSIFHENKIKRSIDMGSYIDHILNAAEGSMDTLLFLFDKDKDIPIDHLETTVKTTPSAFLYWWGKYGIPVEELEYAVGDVIFYRLANKHVYGAIRIVSMSPRIIEIYHTFI